MDANLLYNIFISYIFILYTLISTEYIYNQYLCLNVVWLEQGYMYVEIFNYQNWFNIQNYVYFFSQSLKFDQYFWSCDHMLILFWI